MALEQEIEAFNRMKPELEKHHFDKWVVIKDSELVGAFDTFDAAAETAVRRFGRGPYLIRVITEQSGVKGLWPVLQA